MAVNLHYPDCDETLNMSKPRLLLLTQLAGVLALSLVFLFQPAPSFAQPTQLGVTLIERYTLPTIGLGSAQERALPGGVNDRGLHMGGIFSGLDHAQGDPENVFYAIADRGPNSPITVGKNRRRTFAVPEYNPTIYKILVTGDRIQIIDRIPILTISNQPVTGLPNTSNDEIPYSYDGRTRLQLNPNGLDPEGLAHATDGTFWVSDEYSPSVAQIAADGKVVHRLIPAGMTLSSDTDVRPVLPAIYAKRRLNRGFEGLTISQDGKSLFIALQSPLDFPTESIGRVSRTIRLLVVDTQKLIPVAEYVYVAEEASSFGANKQGKMKIGDLAFVNPTSLLVVERTNKVARIYQVDLSGATNILGTRWSDPHNTTGTLEALAPDQLATNSINPVSKSLLVDLNQIPKMPKKIEGLTIVNPSAIALGNDNDFGFDRFDTNGRAINNNLPNELVILHLSQPLPLTH